MSLIAIALAVELNIGSDPISKCVLILLANRHMQDTNDCFPSIERISAEAGCSTRTVVSKLALLEAGGHLVARVRHDAAGRRLTNNYLLTFVPFTADDGTKPPLPKRRASIPTEGWMPSAAAIEKIREEFPHHETGDDAIRDHVAGWIDWAKGQARTYVDHEAGWRNSIRGFLRKQSTGATPLAQPRGDRRPSSGIFSAVADLLSDSGTS
jgi:DNA-binding transcriptional MocR family regulator